MSSPFNRRPWPMKWVVLAIALCVVPYTYITLKYRKPGPAYQPYEDSKKRANVMRLLDAGYRRIIATAERPSDPQALLRPTANPAVISPAQGGITAVLATTLVEMPDLPVNYSAVYAAGETTATRPYRVVVTCTLPDPKHQLGGAEVYVRGENVVIVPIFEPIAGGLIARTTENIVTISLPAGALPSGAYTVHLAGRDQSRQWPLVVR